MARAARSRRRTAQPGACAQCHPLAEAGQASAERCAGALFHLAAGLRFFMSTTRVAEGELLIHSVRSPWVTMPGPLGVKPQARQGLRKLTF